MGHWHDVVDELRDPARDLRAAIPDTWSAGTRESRAAMADGALPGRTKELIALAIAVVEQCDGCIAFHARSASKAGATPAEVAEALGVAIAMRGGPARTYAPRAWAAYQEFRADGTT
jgi:AhpD family alkylhydroperoxidase